MKLEEVEKSAMQLPDAERANLAAALLSSLSAVLVESDDGVAEAYRRSKELDVDPQAATSWQAIKRDLNR